MTQKPQGVQEVFDVRLVQAAFEAAKVEYPTTPDIVQQVMDALWLTTKEFAFNVYGEEPEHAERTPEEVLEIVFRRTMARQFLAGIVYGRAVGA
jgi:hypothetical protein